MAHHQFTVERLIKKLQKLDPKLKVTVGDCAGTTNGKLVGAGEFGGKVSLEFEETMHEGEEV